MLISDKSSKVQNRVKSLILELSNISKYYDSKIAVENVSFQILAGTINVLLGPNGAGKSTIARIMLGIEAPLSGQVKKTSGLKVAYVPQNLNIASTIPITCKEFAKINGIILTENIINFLYEDPHLLAGIWSKELFKLSHGQRQLFLLALAFSSHAGLVVLDEPTSFLDIDSEARFYTMITDLKKQSPSTSVFIISHDMHHVINSADQVLCINHHICCSGKPIRDYDDTARDIVSTYKHTHDHKH